VGGGEGIDGLLMRVRVAGRQLSELSGDSTGRGAAACDLGHAVAADLEPLLAALDDGSPAARAAARAAGERFASHVLAAGLLQASDASATSVLEILGRGLIRLTADLERLARTRRIPA
jgi:hypothetical protein